MTEILETAMLICFGCSWPISLVKNIRAKSAENTSLGFICLIIFGYVAGIVAKLIAHNYSFVLIAYALNLIIVLANMVVYFINKRLDAERSAYNNLNNKEYTSMNTLSDTLKKYREMNKVACAEGIVLFGSTYLSGIPMVELARDMELNERIYNRSIEKLTIGDADTVVKDCICALSPKKVFINIGDEDILLENFNEKEFMAKYEWLLYSLHRNCDAQLYIISIQSRSQLAARINTSLRKLAEDTGCTFIDCVPCLYYSSPEIRVFNTLRPYMRDHSITFAEAMRMAN